MDIDYYQLSFFLVAAVVGYLIVRVITPPNATPEDDRAWRNDGMLFKNAHFINFAVAANAVLVTHYAALTISPPSTLPLLCPTEGSGQRNAALFTWSPLTAAVFLGVLVGAPLRLRAYSGLGENFTFGLAKPSGLITTGVYRYMQHPSYTGIITVSIAAFAVFLRFDGAVACFVPPAYWPLVQAWGPTAYTAGIVLVVQQLIMRVLQEEAMLKELFGKEWEEWHAKTARFIPGLI